MDANLTLRTDGATAFGWLIASLTPPLFASLAGEGVRDGKGAGAPVKLSAVKNAPVPRK